MKNCILITLVVFACISARAGDKIKYYFNQPVDNSVSTGVNAVYLNNCIADTLVAYLNRAKYSLDICVYEYSNDSIAPRIAEAVNNAYNRGVNVRWIYEGSNSNSGLTLLNSNIHTLPSPQGGSYTIMHNKFVVIDGNSVDPGDAIVWTGCLNWYVQQFDWDYNNVVIIQDSALAHAYLGEFNMMWGGTGIAPNLAASKFGSHKTDLGRHIFTIEGNTVELYFSPSDGTETHIQSTIATADTDMYFGMYTFTSTMDASLIMSKYNSGVYVAGLDDSWSNSYTPYSTFNSGLGANFKVYTETDTSLYHNKFLIVDPSNPCSDPTVLTGSHNWSISANTHNDENTLIIHNDTAANLFYQYFKATFNSLGGTLAAKQGCPNTAVSVNAVDYSVKVYPNPSHGDIVVSYQLASPQKITIEIYNITGQKITTLIDSALQLEGKYTCNYTLHTPGVYFVRMLGGDASITRKVLISGK